jgi:hypothetical protein
MCCTVLGNQGMSCDHRSPDDSSRPGLKDILVPCLHLKLKGVMLLASMLRTVSSIGQAQCMRARRDLYFSDPQTRVKGPIVECHEAYRLWQDDASIGLRAVGLRGGSEATQQPACPSKKEYGPTEYSLHGSLSTSIPGSADIVCRAYGVFPGVATSF